MQTFIYGMLGLPFVFALLAISGFVNNSILHILNRIIATIVGGIFVKMLMLLPPGEVFNSEYF